MKKAQQKDARLDWTPVARQYPRKDATLFAQQSNNPAPRDKASVTELRPDLRLSEIEKYQNYLALQPGIPYERAGGLYSGRTDVGIDSWGWLAIPCFQCGYSVRTHVDVDEGGETPIAHRDSSGAYFEDDIVTCKGCYLETRYFVTEAEAA